MVNTIPPDTVAQGQTGHIAAHNNISDVLTAMSSQLQALPATRYGTAALIAGTVSVALPGIDSGSVVLLSRMTPGGTLGHLSVPSVVPGTGFTVSSSSGNETSLIGWAVLG